MNKNTAHLFIFVILAALHSGCSSYKTLKLDELYGISVPAERTVETISEGQVDYWQEVKPILDKRCIVCHACYDAPCQAKMTAPEGLSRGASKARIYHPERLMAAPLTRLFEDAQNVQQWRDKGFYPLLNEHQDRSEEANAHASVLYQMLQLKKYNPLPDSTILSDEFTLGINRDESCPSEESFPSFSQKHPLWGMPYALPALQEAESDTLMRWIEEGGQYTKRAALPNRFQSEIHKWEMFLNQGTLKSQLSSRYIYEHLFIAHLYFNELDERQFFKLVRSSTPPGEALDIIATRRPYDDPKVEKFYYRLMPERETIVAKTHLPYALNDQRMHFWQELFLDPDYDVDQLPDYSKKTTGNPFLVFKAIPVSSRHRFLLDEAQFSIMNFIKGPVCRGQTALNVIRDHFWVFFVSPDFDRASRISEFLELQQDDLELPSVRGDINLPLSNWIRYSHKQKKLLQARDDFLAREFAKHPSELGIDLVWNGEGKNLNAALTIFRHFDSASVEQGLIGQAPQTAWLIDYPLLERIHYLLVAGYDVYGNAGHQLLSRLYMDFLRMEGEANFLMLLPTEARVSERDNWYRGAPKRTLDYISQPSLDSKIQTNISYTSSMPKQELYTKLQRHLSGALQQKRALSNFPEDIEFQLARLSTLSGAQTRFLPQIAHMVISEGQQQYHATLIKNNAHLNITSMFKESKNLIESENTLTVSKGIIGSYPNIFLTVERKNLEDMVSSLMNLSSSESYKSLLDTHGIRRTNQHFWKFSDALHAQFLIDEPVEFGFLDYSRFENR